MSAVAHAALPSLELSPAAAAAPAARIMVVDDSSTIKKTAKLFLEQGGYQVTLVDDGMQALNAVMRDPPALVLMDVIMPRLDGLAACSLIRQYPRFRSLPIVLLTSKDTELDRARGKLQGATEYLAKPFNKSDLLALVSKLIPNGEKP